MKAIIVNAKKYTKDTARMWEMGIDTKDEKFEWTAMLINVDDISYMYPEEGKVNIQLKSGPLLETDTIWSNPAPIFREKECY